MTKHIASFGFAFMLCVGFSFAQCTGHTEKAAATTPAKACCSKEQAAAGKSCCKDKASASVEGANATAVSNTSEAAPVTEETIVTKKPRNRVKAVRNESK